VSTQALFLTKGGLVSMGRIGTSKAHSRYKDFNKKLKVQRFMP
jgi:hypothetical protein